MPITMEEILEIRNELMADDVDVPPEALSWVSCEVREFFESGGRVIPRPPGFEGAEIHAWYELEQRRFEQTDTDTMMDALSAALFKTTGDEEFKPEEKEEEVPLEYNFGDRDAPGPEKYDPTLKYKCPQLGDALPEDDCM